LMAWGVIVGGAGRGGCGSSGGVHYSIFVVFKRRWRWVVGEVHISWLF
jgi:hypothetical protein